MRRFFYGRYGVDALGRFLNWVGMGLLLLGMLTLPVFSSMGIAFSFYGLFRMLSRNFYRRSAENSAYLHLHGRAAGWLRQRKTRLAQRGTHRFFRCPSCKRTVRVPRGKGKIAITCPACRAEFIRTS